MFGRCGQGGTAMIKIVRKLNPFSSYEIEYLESWLTDMAKQGLLVDNITLWFASFTQGEPKNRRYRILPKVMGDVSDEEKEFYSQQQWNFEFSFSGLNVFYTDSGNAEELFTDAASFAAYTKKYAIVELFFLLTFPFICYWWFISNFGDSDSLIPSLHLIHEFGLTLTLCIAILFLLVIFYLIRMSIASALLIIKIKKNIMLVHDKPYKKMAKIYRIITVITIATFISFPLSVIISHNVLGTSISYSETASYQGTHPVMLQEIDPNNWALVQECIDSEVWYGDIGYSIDSYWDGLFWRIVTEEVDISKSEDEWVFYSATYYNARSISIAQLYLKEEMASIYSEDVSMKDIIIDCNNVDYAGYYYDAEYSQQYLYVLNGTQLETIVYRGEINLLDKIELFVADVSNK
jgi:hypothetical protein